MTTTVRIAFAGFSLESVTAVPQPVDLADFERVCTRGDQIVEHFAGTNTVPGGCLRIAAEQGVQVVPLFHTLLGALGPASDAAVAAYTAEILAGLRQNGELAGVLLFLHGACWAPGYEDVERYIIDTVREAFPDIAIAVALDYHGNIDAQTLRSADIAVAYRHSPHIDMGETGERATKALLRMIDTGETPGLAVAPVGVVIPSIMSATSLEPLASIIASARALESDSDCDISLMAGFSYADSTNTGMSVVVLDWAGQFAAQEKAEGFAARLYAARHALSSAVPVWTIAEALANLELTHSPGRPVVLVEHADRMNDSTFLLRALLEHQRESHSRLKVMVPFLLDPVAAALAHDIGAGSLITLCVGGHSSSHTGGSVTVLARVIWSGEKDYIVSGRYQNGSRVSLGVTALIEIGTLRVSLVSHFAFAVDSDPFTIFGECVEDYDVVLLRSKTHFRDFYEPIADRVLIVDTPDLGPADVRHIQYQQLNTTKIFPWLDSTALDHQL